MHVLQATNVNVVGVRTQFLQPFKFVQCHLTEVLDLVIYTSKK
jgi:hypothetical protein